MTSSDFGIGYPGHPYNCMLCLKFWGKSCYLIIQSGAVCDPIHWFIPATRMCLSQYMLYALRFEVCVFVDIDDIVELSISSQNNIEIVIDKCKYSKEKWTHIKKNTIQTTHLSKKEATYRLQIEHNKSLCLENVIHYYGDVLNQMFVVKWGAWISTRAIDFPFYHILSPSNCKIKTSLIPDVHWNIKHHQYSVVL